MNSKRQPAAPSPRPHPGTRGGAFRAPCVSFPKRQQNVRKGEAHGRLRVTLLPSAGRSPAGQGGADNGGLAELPICCSGCQSQSSAHRQRRTRGKKEVTWVPPTRPFHVTFPETEKGGFTTWLCHATEKPMCANPKPGLTGGELSPMHRHSDGLTRVSRLYL